MGERMRKILYYENILEFKESTNSALHLSEVKEWQLCRTCLADTNCEQDADLDNMCVMDAVEGRFINVRDMLRAATGAEISVDDGLPLRVCKDCLNKITTIYFFKIQIKRAEHVIKRLVEKLGGTSNKDVKTEVDVTINEADCSCSTGGEIVMEISVPSSCNEETSQISDEDEPSKDANVNNGDVEKQSEKCLDSIGDADESGEVLEIETIHNDYQRTTENEETASEADKLDEISEEYFLEEVQEFINDDGDDDDDASDSKDVILLKLGSPNDTQSSCVGGKSTSSKKVFTPNTETRTTDSFRKSKHKQPRLNAPLLENLICALCDKAFNVQRELVEHVQKVHPNSKAYKCRECGTMFAHMQSLSRHMQTHKPVQYKNVCDFCGKAFLRSDDWRRHKRVHTGERPYVCNMCDKAFKQAGELKEHQLTHNKVRRYVCNICGHRLSSRNGFYIHKKAHEGIKNYVCVQCDKRFLTSGELKSHMNVHLRRSRTEK